VSFWVSLGSSSTRARSTSSEASEDLRAGLSGSPVQLFAPSSRCSCRSPAWRGCSEELPSDGGPRVTGQPTTAVVLPQHADQHLPERPILPAVESIFQMRRARADEAWDGWPAMSGWDEESPEEFEKSPGAARPTPQQISYAIAGSTRRAVRFCR
jgi:hypothetical protein